MTAIRSAVRELILQKGGFNNILNADIMAIEKKFKITHFDVMNVLDYFKYSKQQAKFRMEHGF